MFCVVCGKPMSDCEWKTCEMCFVNGLDGPGLNLFYGGNFYDRQTKNSGTEHDMRPLPGGDTKRR